MSTYTEFVSSPQSNCYSLNFPGATDEYVNCGNIFNIDADFTMECWFKTDVLPSVGGRHMAVLGKSGPAADFDLLLINPDNKIYFYFTVNTVSYNIISDAAVSIDTWYHVAVIWDKGTVLKMYVNGAAQSSTANPSGNRVTNSNDFHIGDSVEWANREFDGQIDEIRLWSVIRTLNEINYYKERRLNGNETDLEYYWRCDEGSGAKIYSDSAAHPDAEGIFVGNISFNENVPYSDSDLDEDSPFMESIAKGLRDNLQRCEEIFERTPYIVLQSSGSRDDYRGVYDFTLHGYDWELEATHHIWIPNIHIFTKLCAMIKLGKRLNPTNHFIKIKLNESSSQETVISGGPNQWKQFNPIILLPANKGLVSGKGRWNKLEIYTINTTGRENDTCGSLICWLSTIRTEYEGLDI